MRARRTAKRVLVAAVLVAVVPEVAACAAYAWWALYGRDAHDPLARLLFSVVPEPLSRWACGPLSRRFPDDPGNCYRAP